MNVRNQNPAIAQMEGRILKKPSVGNPLQRPTENHQVIEENLLITTRGKLLKTGKAAE